MNKDHPCLVIMPFGKTSGEKLISLLIYENIIRPAFEEAGIRETRIDTEQLLHRAINATVESHLRTAPLVLVDITGNNPNVLYELGFRKAQGKPFVCISSNPSDAVFYAKDFQIIDYTRENAVSKIASAIRAAFTEFPIRLSAQDEIELLASAIHRESFENPFQDRIAAWRIKRAIEQVEYIQKRQWEFEAKSATAYVAYIFQGIMDLLRKGEEYLTLTNLHFWSSSAVGESAFLRANIEAAKRGVVIKRIFLIDKSDIYRRRSDRELEALIQSHRRAQREVNLINPGNLDLKCILTENLEADLERYGHFGLARDSTETFGMEKGCVVIVPRYEASLLTGIISHLKLTFSNGSSVADMRTREYVERYESALSIAEDFDKAMSQYRIERTM